jgi:hypothetical protein
MIRKILVFLLVVLIIIQFFRPAKNISTAAQPNALSAVYPIPENVDTIMKYACYDCHTNNSRYPWYFKVQPSAWFLANHIKDGKRHFNFDEFMTYSKEKQDDKLKDLVEMVDDDDMPLSSYTWMHADARLTQEEKAAITTWAKQLRAKISK